MQRRRDLGVMMILFVGGLTARGQAAPDAAAGATTFARSCSGCHGSDGRGGERAPDIATARLVASRSTVDLEGIVKNGVQGRGMPAFGFMGDKSVSDVVAYLRKLQGKDVAVHVGGDPAAGRTIFFGKGECARCHMVKGAGGFLGPDLSAYTNGMTAEMIRLAITKPDRMVQPDYAVVEVTLSDGTHLEGNVRAEDNFTLSLQTGDGVFHSLSKSSLREVRRTHHSVMPRDYSTVLAEKEMNDLVGYLSVMASDAPEKPARRRNP